MGEGVHEMVVDAAIEDVWDFVSVLDHWAPLAPGYINHKIISDEISEWKFKVDTGLFKKKVHAKVEIQEWSKPNRVTFTLTGINEKFSGDGSFEASSLSGSQTNVKGRLSIRPYSSMTKLVSPIIEKTVPDMTKELTNNVVSEIQKRYSARR
ncbi:CoxG family protein [Bacillus sp. Marseille-Q1617]|uniref:CoxG family protein n=1 Tax=Bacillus sp. Marseille-Q1617 TaxID=2736887 RepID=UPI00158962C4|nr:SRPBCC family protein [Bacillus sp. Marseille-Q1617]